MSDVATGRVIVIADGPGSWFPVEKYRWGGGGGGGGGRLLNSTFEASFVCIIFFLSHSVCLSAAVLGYSSKAKVNIFNIQSCI